MAEVARGHVDEDSVRVQLSPGDTSSNSQAEEDEAPESTEPLHKRGKVPKRYKSGEIKKNSVDNSCVVARWLVTHYQESKGSYLLKGSVWRAYREDVRTFNSQQHAHTARHAHFTCVLQNVFPKVQFTKKKPHRDFKEAVNLILNLKKRDPVTPEPFGWEEILLCHDSASLNGWVPTNAICQPESELSEITWREWSWFDKNVSASGEAHTRRILIDSQLGWQLWIHNYKMTQFNLGCTNITSDLELELLMAVARCIPLCQGFQVSRNVQSHDASGQVIGTTEQWRQGVPKGKVVYMHRSENCLLLRPLTTNRGFICGVCAELQERFKRDTKDLIMDETSKRKRKRKSGHAEIKSELGVEEVEAVVLHKRYRCLWCNYSTNRANHFQMHASAHSEERPFACDKCDHKAKTLAMLRNHQVRHSDEKPLQCTECDFTTKHHNSLHLHKLIHTEDKPLRCGLCDFSTKHQNSLKSHMLKHTNKKPFQCGQCDFSTKHRVSLTLHIRTHTKERPYKCNKCDFSASCSSNLRQHEQTHSSERNFQCVICGGYFRSSSTLKSHMATHTDSKPHACDICGVAFRQRGNLLRHIQSHTGVKKFSCPHCALKFTLAANMRRHIKVIHTHKQTYVCEQCGKPMSSANNLHRHVTTVHEGLKEYGCPVCNKEYTCGSNLKKHLTTHVSSIESLSDESMNQTRCDVPTKPKRAKKLRAAGDVPDEDIVRLVRKIKRHRRIDGDLKLQVKLRDRNSSQTPLYTDLVDDSDEECGGENMEQATKIELNAAEVGGDDVSDDALDDAIDNSIKGDETSSGSDFIKSEDDIRMICGTNCRVVIVRIKEIDDLVRDDASEELDDMVGSPASAMHEEHSTSVVDESDPAIHQSAASETRKFRILAASSTTAVVEDAAKMRNSRISAASLSPALTDIESLVSDCGYVINSQHHSSAWKDVLLPAQDHSSHVSTSHEDTMPHPVSVLDHSYDDGCDSFADDIESVLTVDQSLSVECLSEVSGAAKVQVEMVDQGGIDISYSVHALQEYDTVGPVHSDHR